MGAAIHLLGATLAKHPVLVVAAFEPEGDTEKALTTQIVFEQFHACAFYVCDPVVATLFSVGIFTGLVVLVDNNLNVGCVYEGYRLPHANVYLRREEGSHSRGVNAVAHHIGLAIK